MKLIVGLGNPGKDFALSRHNIGFLVINQLAKTNAIALKERKFKSRWGKGKIAGHEVMLVKPHTFMNLSGEAVKRFQECFALKPHQLIVIHDDLDLDWGRIKIKEKGGHGGHKGIQSIMSTLGDGEFIRVRVGIGRPEKEADVTEYVLQPFVETEMSSLDKVISKAQAAVEILFEMGVHAAMNLYNRRPYQSLI